MYQSIHMGQSMAGHILDKLSQRIQKMSQSYRTKLQNWCAQAVTQRYFPKMDIFDPKSDHKDFIIQQKQPDPPNPKLFFEFPSLAQEKNKNKEKFQKRNNNIEFNQRKIQNLKNEKNNKRKLSLQHSSICNKGLPNNNGTTIKEIVKTQKIINQNVSKQQEKQNYLGKINKAHSKLGLNLKFNNKNALKIKQQNRMSRLGSNRTTYLVPLSKDKDGQLQQSKQIKSIVFKNDGSLSHPLKILRLEHKISQKESTRNKADILSKDMKFNSSIKNSNKKLKINVDKPNQNIDQSLKSQRSKSQKKPLNSKDPDRQYFQQHKVGNRLKNTKMVQYAKNRTNLDKNRLMLGSKNEGPKQKQGDIIHVINDKIMKKLFLVPAQSFYASRFVKFTNTQSPSSQQT